MSEVTETVRFSKKHYNDIEPAKLCIYTYHISSAKCRRSFRIRESEYCLRNRVALKNCTFAWEPPNVIA